MAVNSQVAQYGAQFAGAAATGSTQQQINAGAALGGAGLLAILGPSAAAGPIGLAVAGGVVAIQALSGKISHLISGCGSSCTQATSIVNEADTYVQQIASAYWQTPIRPKVFQQWTLDQIEGIFQQIRNLCDPGKLGDAGRRCISERLVRGGSAPWCPTGTGCDWYTVTYDPIANDAGVTPDPGPEQLVSSAVASVAHVVPGGYGTMAVAVLGVFALVAYKVRT